MADVPRSGEASQPLPERFGRYRIIKRLGAGGMGSVHLAEDTQLGRRVALKVPHFGPQDGPEARQRFIREARIAATLDHVSLCPVYDVGEFEGLCFLTMAYIEGKSLAETIPGAGLPPRQAAALVGKLAIALQEAHAKGVIHRDLKPANIMLKGTGHGREPVIVDFGLARHDDVGEVRVTKTGQVMGTLGYMSPEQIRGDPEAIGPACDIYALGVILYELLTGDLPFHGSGLAVVGQILTQEPLSLVELRPDVDPRLEAICLKAMARKVEDRTTSMGALATALGEYLRPASTSTSTQPSTVGRQQPESSAAWARPALAAGVVLLGLIVAWASGVFQGKDKEGVIVLENVPGPAEVLLDGARVPLHRPDGGGVEEIRMSPGRRQLMVQQDGFQPFAEDVTLGAGERTRVRVRLVPLLASRPKENDTGTWPKPVEPKSPVGVVAPQVIPPKEAVPEVTPNQPPPPIAEVKSAPTEPVAAARPTQAPEEAPKAITNTIGMKLVLIPAGAFLMGSPDSDKDAEDDEKPPHRVRITRPFYLGATEVTQGQYKAVTGANPSAFQGSDDLPVEKVSWNEAIAFCNGLSDREGLKPCYNVGLLTANNAKKGRKPASKVVDTRVSILGGGYRLPTEAEWEYAYRAGSTTRYSSGDDAASLGEFAWCNVNSDKKTHPVGQKRPNAWGLYDMHGNVWEWCWDWYDSVYYRQSPDSDPLGPSQATHRVNRGGSWFSDPRGPRSALRTRSAPGYRNLTLGFRVARVRSGP